MQLAATWRPEGLEYPSDSDKIQTTEMHDDIPWDVVVQVAEAATPDGYKFVGVEKL